MSVNGLRPAVGFLCGPVTVSVSLLLEFIAGQKWLTKAILQLMQKENKKVWIQHYQNTVNYIRKWRLHLKIS